MSAISQPEPGGDAGRVRCLYCGANNFPASLACWQCSRPLKAARIAFGDAPAQDASQFPLSGQPSSGAAVRPPLTGLPLTESPLAPKAAAALGMLFPYVGLPAGIIFLMLDDPRKTQLGWLLIGWSIAGTVLSVLSLAATLGPLWVVLRGMLPHAGSSPPALPGVPGDSGEGLFLLLSSLF